MIVKLNQERTKLNRSGVSAYQLGVAQYLLSVGFGKRALEALRAASRERSSAANACPAYLVLILSEPSCDIRVIRKTKNLASEDRKEKSE